MHAVIPTLVETGAGGAGPALSPVAETAAMIKTVSTLIEGRFLEIGSNLGSATEVLRTLVVTCQHLVEELGSPDLQSATRDLERAAADVAVLSGPQGERPETLSGMMALTRSITQHICDAVEALKPASVLAINAKIEAARLGTAGADFIEFSTEINRSLNAARATLGQVDSKTANLRYQLQAVYDQDVELSRRKGEAVRHVPTRIATSVSAIAARGSEAASVAAAVARQSEHISRQVSASVMALQIGDATRQRAEHVQFALGLALRIATSAVPGVSEDVMALAALPETRRRALLAACCELQAIQLVDAAEELGRDARQILASLRGLAVNAHDIARIGGELYGADCGDRNFLHDLEEGVAGARALLEDVRGARDFTDQVVSSATESAGELVGTIGTVRSIESDVRHLALNAFLKCGRLGQQGRTLSIIAEELRVCADRTAAETGTVATNLEDLLGLAKQLAERGATDVDVDATAMARSMTGAAQRLSVSGQRVSASLETLRRESDLAAQLLDTTASQITVHEEVGSVLRRGAATLTALAEELKRNAEGSPEDLESFLAAIFSQYTMSRERDIHKEFQSLMYGVVPTGLDKDW
jgi:Asp-tRNA(Asn)/Glu-tRNA(Gln) amidotransferase C subunit